MRNFNLKNKIGFIIILFLVVFSFSNKVSAAVSFDPTSHATKISETKVGLTIKLKNSEEIGYDFNVCGPNAPHIISTNSYLNIDSSTPVNKYIYALCITLKKKDGTVVKQPSLYAIAKNAPSQEIILAFDGLAANTIYVWEAKIKKENVYTLLDRGFVIRDTGVLEGDPASLTEDVFQEITTQQNAIDAAQTLTDTTYTPLASLPGLETFDSNRPNAFADYFNTILRLFIGICAVLAMVMIVIGGIEYMTSELSHSKEEGKERITHAILGLIIALGSFALLNTINPRTLDVSLSGLGSASVAYNSASSEYRLSETQSIDMGSGFVRSNYYDLIKTVSAQPQFALPPCLLQVAIQRESRGIPKLIGHDEDVPSASIRSRREFIASGKRFDGTTFPPGTTTDPRITDKTFKNTDHPSDYKAAPNPSASDLGLDWRFSHSVGMFGITFGPNNLPPAGAPTVYNDPNADIQAGATIMKSFYKKCGGNIEGIWRAYLSGSCSGSSAYVNSETAVRMTLYNKCITQDL